MLFAALTDLFAVLICVFALAKGGLAERVGAGVVLANTLAYIVNETTLHNPVANLVIDALTAVAFLAIAVRYASFWQGAVMLLYASQFSLHAVYFVLERPRDMLHVIVNDVIFYAILGCLAAGAALAWRRRRLAART